MSLINDGITTKWRIGAWSPLTGYPSCVAFHEQRLYFANTPAQPNTMWGSVAGDYDNHAPTDEQSRVLDDSALSYTLASARLNEIRWLNSGPTLIIGTMGDEWQVRAASSINNPITPTDISVVRHTSFGSKYRTHSVRIGGSTFFIQRSGKRVRELSYDFNTDSLQAKDVNVVSDHILKSQATTMKYQQEPNSMMWVVRSDGILSGLTYVKDQDVYAWHRHKLGGTFEGSNAKVISAAVITSFDNEDVLYLAVKRTIGGVEKVTIETLSTEVEAEDPTDKSSFNFLDCSVVYSGAPATVIPGLTHLIGLEVDILADGVKSASQVVSGAGTITLTVAASEVIVGLRARSLVETLDYEGMNTGVAPTIGKIRRIDHMGMRVLDSMGFKMGPSEDKLRQFSFRTSDAPMDSAAPLYTGDTDVPVETGYSQRGGLVVVQDDPYPLNILALIVDGESAT